MVTLPQNSLLTLVKRELYQRSRNVLCSKRCLGTVHHSIRALPNDKNTTEKVKVHNIDDIDVESFAESFGYTWLTHWKLLQEDSAFRNQIMEMKYSRRNQRNEYLRNSIRVLARDEKELVESECSSLGEPVNGGVEHQGEHDEELVEWLLSIPGDGEDESLVCDEKGIYVDLGDTEMSISPLWISVQVSEGDNKKAKLYESVVPIEDEVLLHLDTQMKPFLEIEDLSFDDMPEVKRGQWRNFFIGLIGEVSAEEDGNLWPNQVLHKDRCLFNVRNAMDLAKFLSDPRKEDIESHKQNLERLAAERGYKSGWCWHLLRSRWGKRNLEKFGVTESSFR